MISLPLSAGCTSDSLALKSLTVSQGEILSGNPLRGQNSSLTFQFTNPATGNIANCSAAGPQITPNGIGSDPTIWYDCVNGATSSTTRTSFQFEPTLVQLTINQTWSCTDKEPAYVKQLHSSNALLSASNAEELLT
jgi:hypothetical protein